MAEADGAEGDRRQQFELLLCADRFGQEPGMGEVALDRFAMGAPAVILQRLRELQRSEPARQFDGFLKEGESG